MKERKGRTLEQMLELNAKALTDIAQFKVSQQKAEEEGLRAFQKANCAKGCRFANDAMVGTGKPCCRYPGGLISDGTTCFSRVTKGSDPILTCRVCKREVKYSDIPNSMDGGSKDELYELRVCNWNCARNIK